MSTFSPAEQPAPASQSLLRRWRRALLWGALLLLLGVAQSLLVALTVRVEVTRAQDATEAVATDAPLTRKQQYQKIIEEYPLVKELKERLKLELD